jgi:aspartyl-tRNA(Asn)/glutamyl-tRNA(Gln) amidotransferase subunit A
MSDSIHYLTLTELSHRIKHRQLSCQTATDAILQRINDLNPRINCYIDVFHDDARKRAKQLDNEIGNGRWRGILHGIPIGIKDIFDFENHQSSAGSLLPREKSGQIATVVAKLESAGAIILGTLNMDELAAGGTGDNVHYGRCNNPWNPGHITGGSSGGSAAAVAAGLAFAAIGSDAGGSIRIPAAFCGITGLKPTYGRVSRYGAMARTWTMDCIGPLTRCVEDADAVLNVIQGLDQNDATSVDTRQLGLDSNLGKAESCIVGVVKLDPIYQLDNNFQSARNLLQQSGQLIQEVTLPDLDLYTQMQQVIVKSEGAAMHRKALLDSESAMSFAVRSVIKGGLDIDAVEYIEALSIRSSVLNHLTEIVMADVDLLMLPVSMPTAPEFKPPETMESAEIDKDFSTMATMTRFANYLGLPAISIPTGLSPEGLPTALQLVAKPFEESKMVKVAAQYQTLRGPLKNPDLGQVN